MKGWGKIAVAGLAAFLMMALVCVPALAWETRGTDEDDQGWQKLAAGETINDDLLMAGNDIQVDGTVKGDLLVFGRNVTINGSVEGDTVVFANSIALNGKTAGDFRGAAQLVQIAGPVGGNLTVACEQMILDKNAHIVRNATLAGSTLKVEGPVDGRLEGVFGSAVLNSRIGRDVSLNVDRLELGPAAGINGQLDYTSRNELERDASAVIGGKITRHEPPVTEAQTPAAETSSDSGFFSFFGVIMGIVSSFVIWAIWTAVHPRSFAAVQEELADKPLPALGWGMLAIIAAPVACLLVLLTIIGIPVSFTAFLMYLVVFMLADTVAGCYIGRKISENSRSEVLKKPWVEALLGITLLQIICTVPILGFWVGLAASALCFGAVLLALAAGRKPLIEVQAETEV